MLVCPQCQFENPSLNKFCQECGTSLSQEVYLSGDRPITIDVQTYSTLRSQLHQVIPQVLDSCEPGQGSLSLEDRSHLTLLVDRLRHDRALSMPQILHWLHEMVSIWEALAPWQCCQSLLDPQNLRIDEDQMLCLQKLYPDPSPAPSLRHLGEVWQFLLDQRSQTQIAALYLLIADLQTGKLITTDELRSQLEAIAHEIQASLTETDIMPNPQDLPASDSPSVPLESFEDEALEAVTLQPEEEGDDMPTVILPMQLFSLEDAGKTDIGRTRDHNEDCFGIDTTIIKTQTPPGRTVQAQGLYILCDGMGGHASGEVASQLAVDTLRRYFRDYWSAADAANPSGLPPLATIREAVQLANQAIYDVNQQNARSGSGRMGTTMVVLLIQGTEAAVAHVGDSRLYRYSRKGGLKQLTIDHEVGQREIQRGIEATIAYSRPDAYQLTQALGPRDENFISPDVQFFELNEDMVLILASDGLTDNDLLETHCATHIEPLISSMTNLEQGVNQLIELANQYNGHDNITAIAIRAKVRPNLEQLW